MFVESSEQYNPLLDEYGIHLGVPILCPDTTFIQVPAEPHVFFCKDLYLVSSDKQLKDLQSENTSGTCCIKKLHNIYQQQIQGIQLENVVVMMAHGFNYSPNESGWIFQSTQKTISQTAKAYESFAQLAGYPNLDVLVVCRPDVPDIYREKVNMLLSRNVPHPYIYANSDITLLQTLEAPRRLIPNEGVVLVAKTDTWYGLNTWLKYWNDKSRSTIPDWATLPAIK